MAHDISSPEKLISELSKQFTLRADRHMFPSAPVCDPRYFREVTLERNKPIEFAKKSLFLKGNKGLRSLNVVMASAGMGKSAFLDELSLSLSADFVKDPKGVAVIPVMVSFNTIFFGGYEDPNPAITLGARMLLSYFVEDPNSDKLPLVAEILSLCTQKMIGLDIIKAIVGIILADFKQKHVDASSVSVGLGIDEISKSTVGVEILR